MSSAVVQPSSDVIPPQRSITAAPADGGGGRGGVQERAKRDHFQKETKLTKHDVETLVLFPMRIRIQVLNHSFDLLNRSGKAIIFDWQN